MAYSPTLATPVDRVRFAVYDIDDAAGLLPEETYSALLTRYAAKADPEGWATVAAAEALIARISRDPDKVEVTGAVKVEWSNRLAMLRLIANGKRAELGIAAVGGGVSNALIMGRFTRDT